VSYLSAAFRCEVWKARRSKVLPLTAAAFSLAPLVGGTFMLILKDPEKARQMGLMSAKAQTIQGTADWPTYFGLISQAAAIGGTIVFAIVTAWVFGREFSDRTLKLILALPTPRATIVAAKLLIVAAWSGLLTAWIFMLALLVGSLVGLPGWSGGTLLTGATTLALTVLLTVSLVTPLALIAGVGRGYMAPLGFAILTVFLSQVMAATGRGDWFPWSVPALFTGMAGPRAQVLGAHSYVLVALTSVAGFVATLQWWSRADHTT
jgi:ABC-2 type transport system permease protein